MATKKKKTVQKLLTPTKREVAIKIVMKAMIDGHRKGLTLIDHVELFLSVMSVIYPDAKIRLKVT